MGCDCGVILGNCAVFHVSVIALVFSSDFRPEQLLLFGPSGRITIL